METFVKILSVAAGGAAGAVARYMLNLSPLSGVFERFPLPTFVINVVGSFLIGFLTVFLTDKVAVSDNIRMAVLVGFIGAFTTFSTFEMEIYGLFQFRSFGLSGLYVLLSLVGGFAALLVGVNLARHIDL